MSGGDLDRLISRYLDGLETPEELAQLDELIRRDPAVGQEVVHCATYGEMIRASLAQQNAAEEILGSGVRPDAPARAPSASRRSTRVTATGWRRTSSRRMSCMDAVQVHRRRSAWRGWLPIAAGLAVVVGAALFLDLLAPSKPPAEAIATLLAADAGVTVTPCGGRAGPARAGMPVRVGDAVNTPAGGQATLQYEAPGRREATTVVLLAETAAKFYQEQGAKRVRLEAGTLRCEVAQQPEGRPMRLATPQAEAEVLGTRFVLSVDQDRTRLEVEEGRVRVWDRAGHEAVVRAQTYVEARPSGFATGYVPDAILFQDDFTQGLDRWTCVRSRPGTDGMSVVPPFGPVKVPGDQVHAQPAARGQPAALVFDCPEEGWVFELRPWFEIPETDMVIEYRQKNERLYSAKSKVSLSWRYKSVQLRDQRWFDSASKKAEVGDWIRMRVEMRRRQSPEGLIVRLKIFGDGKPIAEAERLVDDWQQALPMIGWFASRGLIADYSIRVLAPEPAAGKDALRKWK